MIDPLDIIEEYGADFTFYKCAMASIGGVLKLDMQRIQGYRNFGTKLWNAARYAEMNGAKPNNGNLPSPVENLNKWIMGETAKVLRKFKFHLKTSDLMTLLMLSMHSSGKGLRLVCRAVNHSLVHQIQR